MKTIKVGLKGISPLLMHAYPMVSVEGIEKKTPEEQAEVAAYRLDTGMLYVPSTALQRALVGAATYSKGKGRGSLTKQVAAAVFVSPAHLLLGVETYVVDARPVVVPATKGRIVRYRPRLDEWAVQCQIEYDDVLLKESELRKIVDDAGSRVGILDFRPEKKGPFGRFIVVQWAVVR